MLYNFLFIFPLHKRGILNEIDICLYIINNPHKVYFLIMIIISCESSREWVLVRE